MVYTAIKLSLCCLQHLGIRWFRIWTKRKVQIVLLYESYLFHWKSLAVVWRALCNKAETFLNYRGIPVLWSTQNHICLRDSSLQWDWILTVIIVLDLVLWVGNMLQLRFSSSSLGKSISFFLLLCFPLHFLFLFPFLLLNSQNNKGFLEVNM